MISFTKVCFSYSDKKELTIENISFKINKGECVLISGRSGCGKSTVLKLINGIIPNHIKGKLQGEILIDGTRPESVSVQELSKTVGSVFQNPKSQFFNLDTIDEILFGCANHNVPRDEMLKRLEDTVTRFNIRELLGRNIFELSGGQKQKIACASVYASRPKVFVFDEPSANLDIKSIDELKEIIRIIKEAGHTIVIAEHRLYYLMDLCDRIIYMDKGKIEKTYTTDEFIELGDSARKNMGLRTIKPAAIDMNKHSINSKATCNLRMSNLKYSYNKNMILNVDDYSFHNGGIAAVIGDNGAGKTTFANCLCGINKCKGIFEGDKPLKAKTRNKEFSLVMQDVNHQLFTESVLDELMLSYKSDDEEKIREAKELLKKLELLEYSEEHPLSLSGGQKQRVMVAASIFECKDYIILDEPTSGLDYSHMVKVAKLIKELSEETKLIIIITHDIEFINLCCDSIIKIEKGNILNIFH